MTTKLKGRLVALLLLAVVLALPLLRLVQRRAASEDAAPPPPVKISPSPSPTAGKPPRPKPSSQPESPGQTELPGLASSPEEALTMMTDSARKQLDQLHAAGTTSEQKRDIMEGLIHSPLGLDEIWGAIGSLPEGERSEWYTQLADRCAKEQPLKFFQILDEMSPGANRNSVIQSGVRELDFPNLERMMDQVRKQGDAEEIADLAQDFHHVENAALKSTDLLGYARQLPPASEEELEARIPGSPYELRDALAYGAGKLDAESGGKTDLARLRRDFGEETADCYAQGLGTALMENTEDPGKFTTFLAEASISEETRHYLVTSFASSALSNGVTEAVALGEKLAANDADAYYQQLGLQLATRDSAEAARVLGRMPAGRPRQLMAAQLAEHFESKGNTEEAERWREE